MHFSPRPNRAHEIAWQPWGTPAFERARAENKPILLAISAVWCHWCHVMDETSYSDDGVIAKINERFVPVRVDNDLRPDINARYNQGGWPTTAFLTPDGSLLAGATYLPPPQMLAALDQIAQFYSANKTQIEERAAQLRSEHAQTASPEAAQLSPAAITTVIDAVTARFDDEYAGFGSEPKFPMTDVLEFLLLEYRVSRDERLYGMLARTMLAMSGGGMYDRVEGGFFRYSTTRDWTIPHFEKMTEDHAALLRILAGLVRFSHNAAFRSTLVSATAYVRDVLRDPQTGLFAGSQDADEEYYARPLEERRAMQAPYVDRTSYSNWSAAMGAAFITAGNVLEDDRLVEFGMQALDALHLMCDENGLLFHSLAPGGEPQIRGLLTDQAAYLRALLDAHDETGEARFYERALELAEAVLRHFGAPGGGFYDHAAIEEPLGNLSLRDRPLNDNAALADAFARLSSLGAGERFRETAEETLRVYAQTFSKAGIFAAPYARALRRVLSPPVTLFLAGDAADTAELREAAHNLPEPLLTIRTGPPEDGQVSASAYLCIGTACAAPAAGAVQLRSAYESLR